MDLRQMDGAAQVVAERQLEIRTAKRVKNSNMERDSAQASSRIMNLIKKR
jgi:hypothetical protein